MSLAANSDLMDLPEELRAAGGAVLSAMAALGSPVAAVKGNGATGPVVFASPAFIAWSGLSEAALLGKPLPVPMLETGRLLAAPLPGEAFTLFTPGIDAQTPAPAGGRWSAALAGQLVQGAGGDWQWDIERSRIYGDARFSRLYGLSPTEAAEGIDPKRFYAGIHPDDRARIRLAIGAMLRGAEVFSKEYRVLLPDGSVRWVHARGRCEFRDDSPVCFFGTLADITQQKRVEEQLRIAQSAGGVGTFEYVPGFATVSVSAQFCALLGLHETSDLPVYTINSTVLSGDTPLIETHWTKEAERTSQAQLRIRRADTGEVRWLARRGEYLLDGKDDLRFSGVIYDITDVKTTETLLRQLGARLENQVEERTHERDRLWNLSRDLYILCDRADRCISLNPAWGTELGLDIASLLGKPFAELVIPEDRTALETALRRLREGEETDDLELSVSHADGERRSFSWRCIRDGDLIIASGRDVTQRNELEERLRHSQKMEAVGQLTGGLAHDFNNLLTGISGSLELLQMRANQQRFDGIERYIGVAQGAAARAAALTHRLLAFSRRQTLAPKPVVVNQLILDMEELIRRTVGPQIQVDLELEQSPWTTLCDGNQLENALLNLCINARDAMPDGGRLTIRTANDWVSLNNPGEPLAKPSACVTLSVSDTGMGMTPDVVSRAFDPFFTTKPMGAGTGLGLSMVYGFARQSGGQVEIDTQPGRGTTMKLHLPHHALQAPAGPASGEATNTGAPASETVLLVDDETTVRLVVAEVLRDLGYSVLEAENATEALAILQRKPVPELLITDVGLPAGLNGRQLADAARLLHPRLKVIFITGYAENAVLRSGDLEADMHVVVKPFSMEAFGAKVRQVLDGEASDG
ncbi:PAS domain S-box protein [Acetobacteraceae bacterium H6797]|nr:PAS domain S-box protein [Acetobacteraceae bacterium H6797]